jgi:diguanylate cyclase (GGDEF)-like protein
VDEEGRTWRITGSLSDVTERKRTEEALAHEALYDRLTGLPNRAFLEDLLERTARRARRRRDEFLYAVLFLDLDRFKQINDSLGHAVGDRVLVQVGRRLQSCLRPGDVVARLGGDEFCILAVDLTETEDAVQVARRVLTVLEAPVRVDDQEIATGASIGIALADAEREPGDLLRDADTAMYRAKAAGRGRFVLFDRTMQERAVALLRVESELRRGLDRGELRLVYQPVVDLQGRRIVGLEALLRWNHPERGDVPPSAFLPAAERSGFIVPLGWWVLDEACRQMGEWCRELPTMQAQSVSVNLSARQLRQPDLVERVREALDRGGISPDRLRLEVSEPDLMEEPSWHQEVLRELRSLGVEVQLDDFGTGRSFLAHLQGMHVSTLKLDASLVQGRVPDDRRTAVVNAAITLARHLGMRVVAEGVETDDQSEWLEGLACDEGQGYLYSRPLEAEGVPAAVAASATPAA